MVKLNRAGASGAGGRFDAFDISAAIIKPLHERRERIFVPGGDGDGDESRPSAVPSSKPRREPRTTRFTRVGIGQPMKITLEQLYIGETARPRGELLVISTAKDPEDAAEAAASFHWWGRSVEARTHPNMADGSAGTNLMYYSSAEAATKLELAVRLKFDYFPEEVVEAWRKAIVDIGRLPILLGGMTFGPGGAAAAKAVVGVADAGSDLIVNLLDQSIDGEGGVVMGGDLTIAHPGRTEAQAGYLVLTPEGYAVRSRGEGGTSVLTGYASNDGYRSERGTERTETIDIDDRDFYVSSADGKLKHAADGTWDDGTAFEQGDTVEGPWHYAIILINGAPDPKLKKWRPAAVTADLAAKFLSRPKDSALPSLTEKVFSSYSDAVMVNRAADLDAEITAKTKAIKKATAAGDEAAQRELEAAKALLQQQRTAMVDAIEDDKLKELVAG